MPCLELCNLSIEPAMKAALLLRLDLLHAQSRIGVAPLQLNSDLHHLAQHLAQTIGAVGLSLASLHQFLDVMGLHDDGALVAIERAISIGLTAEALDDVAIDAL